MVFLAPPGFEVSAQSLFPVIGAGIVKLGPRNLFRKILLKGEMFRQIVRIDVVRPVVEVFHQPGGGVAQVQRHGEVARATDFGLRRADGLVSRIALGTGGQVGRTLGEDDPALGIADGRDRLKVLLARIRAVGLALPMSSEARMSIRRAMNLRSSPPSIIRASQYTAPLGSLPRMDLMKAEMMS